MSRIIYLVTHGQKEKGPNPGLTPLGKKQIADLKPNLSGKIQLVICGVGRRHLETALILGLEPDLYSAVIGVAESKNRQNNTVILADGTEIPDAKYSAVADRKTAFFELLKNLPSRTVIITSRPMVAILSKGNEVKEATLYRHIPETCHLTEVFTAAGGSVADVWQEV